jgi:hypothetical protein
MDAMYEETMTLEQAEEQLGNELFTVPTMLIDQSAALEAAQRMYSNHRAGVRFFSDFRRTMSVAEMMAAQPTEDEADEESVGAEESSAA